MMNKLLVLILSLICFSTFTSWSRAGAQNQTGQSPAKSELGEAARLMGSADALFKARNYKEAIASVKRALEIRERLLPADDLLIENTLNYLGQLYLLTGDFNAAQVALENVLAKQAKRVGAEDASLTLTLDSLAAVYFQLGDLKSSETSYQRSLTIREKTFGAESSQAAGGLYNLGEYHRARNHFDKAFDFHKRALKIIYQLPVRPKDDYEKILLGCKCAAYQSNDFDRLKEAKEFIDQPPDPKEVGVLNGRAVSLPRPAYPAEALAMREQGVIVIMVSIDEQGFVKSASDLCQGRIWLERRLPPR